MNSTPTLNDLTQLFQNGVMRLQLGDVAGAMQPMVDVVQRLNSEAPNSAVRAHAFAFAAQLKVQCRDYEGALGLLTAIDEITVLDDPDFDEHRVRFMANAAEILCATDRSEEAATRARAAVALAASGNKKSTVVDAYLALVKPLIYLNMLEQAADAAREAQAAAAEFASVFDPGQVITVCLGLHHKSAAATADALAKWWATTGPEDKTALLHEVLGAAYNTSFDDPLYAARLGLLSILCDLVDDSFEPSLRCNLYSLAGNMALQVEDYDAAIDFAAKLTRYADSIGSIEYFCNGLEGQAMAVAKKGESETVELLYKKSIETSAKAQLPELTFRTMKDLGLWYREEGRVQESEALFNDAIEVAKRVAPEAVAECQVSWGASLQHAQEEGAEQLIRAGLENLSYDNPVRFHALVHLAALERNISCGCVNLEVTREVFQAMLEGIVRDNAPPGLLQTFQFEDKGLTLDLARDPTNEEIQQLQPLVLMAQEHLKQTLKKYSAS